jgi:hypothetical protein
LTLKTNFIASISIFMHWCNLVLLIRLSWRQRPFTWRIDGVVVGVHVAAQVHHLVLPNRLVNHLIWFMTKKWGHIREWEETLRRKTQPCRRHGMTTKNPVLGIVNTEFYEVPFDFLWRRHVAFICWDLVTALGPNSGWRMYRDEITVDQ